VARVAVNAKGELWVVTKQGELYNIDPKKPHHQMLNVQDVGIGDDGTVWVTKLGHCGKHPRTSCQARKKNRGWSHKFSANGEIWRLKPGGKWEHIRGGARRVAVDAQGNAWVTSSSGTIYRWAGKDWHKLATGRASDIGASDGKVWVIGGSDTIWNLIKGSEKWVRITGRGVNLAVDGKGLPWIAASNGTLWQNHGPR
jgi:hypothetical protein